DAEAYARWLGKKTGHGYRLPTEAEWEYAARAGTDTPRYWDSRDNPCDFANVADRTAQQAFSWGEKSYVHDCEDGVVHTAKVGMFQPNRFGLHDMLGNVWEWTCSAYDDKYGGAESLCTSDSDSLRVYRSSSWLNQPARVRAALRYKDEATFRSHTLGFRLAREHEPAR
ncbi:MAG: formylglycine-generating enzyme family protein, partial [Methylococcus sp.]